MPANCDICGGELSEDDTHCPYCRAPVLKMVDRDHRNPTTDAGPLPDDGISLLIDKYVSDKKISQDADDRRYSATLDAGSSPLLGDTVTDLADAVRPIRDGDGNYVWDLKYALIGAVVVAIVAALIAAYLLVVSGGAARSHP